MDERSTEVVRLSSRYPYWGYRKIFYLMDRERFPIGREGVRLIRRREGLQVVRKRRKKRVLGRSTQWVHRARHPNHVWSYDFVHDQTTDGKSLRCLTVVDEFTREGLMIHCARSITASDVVRNLAGLIGHHGKPTCIRSDNGPEFVASAVKDWLAEQSIGTHYIEPGSPWQNAYGESFNSIFRTTCLDRWAFESVAESRSVISQWRTEYNTIRPHGSLNASVNHKFERRSHNFRTMGRIHPPPKCATSLEVAAIPQSVPFLPNGVKSNKTLLLRKYPILPPAFTACFGSSGVSPGKQTTIPIVPNVPDSRPKGPRGNSPNLKWPKR